MPFPCGCCCKLKLEELPDIEIEGMEPDGGWTALSDCCFVRRYDYIVLPPRQVISTDLKRSTWHENWSYFTREVEDQFLVCPDPFNCNRADIEYWFYEVERLGLIYELLSVDVFIQKIKVNCPYIGTAEKILISTKHNLMYKGAVLNTTYYVQNFTHTVVATGATSSGGVDQTPNWNDASYWAGYWVAPVPGEYWFNKVLDEMPNYDYILVSECFEPCESDKLCALNCDPLCVTSDPSTGNDFYQGVPFCPAPPYIALTDNYSVRFNGQWCNYSRTVYTINGDVSRINPRLTDFFGSCGKRQLDTNDISRTVDTECVSYEDIELCLHIPITLFFPL